MCSTIYTISSSVYYFLFSYLTSSVYSNHTKTLTQIIYILTKSNHTFNSFILPSLQALTDKAIYANWCGKIGDTHGAG